MAGTSGTTGRQAWWAVRVFLLWRLPLLFLRTGVLCVFEASCLSSEVGGSASLLRAGAFFSWGVFGLVSTVFSVISLFGVCA